MKSIKKGENYWRDSRSDFSHWIKINCLSTFSNCHKSNRPLPNDGNNFHAKKGKKKKPHTPIWRIILHSWIRLECNFSKCYSCFNCGGIMKKSLIIGQINMSWKIQRLVIFLNTSFSNIIILISLRFFDGQFLF